MSRDIDKNDFGVAAILKFKMTHKNKWVKIIKIALTGFHDPENLGIDTKIKTLHTLRVEILAKFHFRVAAILKLP